MDLVAEALAQGAAALAAAGSPSARLDAEVLLAHVLGLRRVDLYTRPERALAPEEEERYRALLLRRAQGEPVSYLVGHKEFFGLTWRVDRRVLIPRPETEVLVERALAWAQAGRHPRPCIADIGTGSGCIAITLAMRLPRARIYATDISTEALEVAAENARRHGVERQVTLLLGDLCDPLPERVDLLVANPPYTVWDELPAGITAYEPRLALDGGDDGLAVYRRLLPQLRDHLGPAGTAMLEVGDGQVEAVQGLVRELVGRVWVRSWADYSGWPRVVEIGPFPGAGSGA